MPTIRQNEYVTFDNPSDRLSIELKKLYGQIDLLDIYFKELLKHYQKLQNQITENKTNHNNLVEAINNYNKLPFYKKLFKKIEI